MFAVQTSKLLFSFFLIFLLSVTFGCGGRPGSTTEAAQARPDAPMVPDNSLPATQATQSQAAAQTSFIASDSAGSQIANNSSPGQGSPEAPFMAGDSLPKASQPTKPQARARSTATAAASIQHNVYLSWAKSSSSVQGYYIYRALSAFGPFTRLNQSPEPATLYSDSTVLSGKVYFYAVTSVNNNGESSYSSIIKAVIPKP